MEKKDKIKKIQKGVFKKFFLLLLKSNPSLKNKIIFSKSSLIFSNFEKQNLYIYNGNSFRSLNVNPFHFSLKFGTFVFTRKIFKYLIKKKKR